MMTIDDYIKLIPPPNLAQPKFMEWVRSHFQLLLDYQHTTLDLYREFLIDSGVGVQLDILGDILQVARQVTFLPGGNISPILPDELYRLVLRAKVLINRWDGTTKQIYEFWNKYLPQYTVIIVDNQDMSETILISGMANDIQGIRLFGFDEDDTTVAGFDAGYWEPVNSLLRDLVTHFYLLPKPAAVRVNFVFLDQPLFGFDQDSQFVKGFDEGEWLDLT